MEYVILSYTDDQRRMSVCFFSITTTDFDER